MWEVSYLREALTRLEQSVHAGVQDISRELFNIENLTYRLIPSNEDRKDTSALVAEIDRAAVDVRSHIDHALRDLATAALTIDKIVHWSKE